MKRCLGIMLSLVMMISFILPVNAADNVDDYLEVIDKLNNEYGANMSLDVDEQEFYNNINEYSVQEFEELLRSQYEGALSISQNQNLEISETIEPLESNGNLRANQLDSARIYNSFSGPNGGVGKVSAVVKVLNKNYLSDITSFDYVSRSSGYYFKTTSTSKSLSSKTGTVKYTGVWRTAQGVTLGVNYSITISYSIYQVV